LLIENQPDKAALKKFRASLRYCLYLEFLQKILPFDDFRLYVDVYVKEVGNCLKVQRLIRSSKPESISAESFENPPITRCGEADQKTSKLGEAEQNISKPSVAEQNISKPSVAVQNISKPGDAEQKISMSSVAVQNIFKPGEAVKNISKPADPGDKTSMTEDAGDKVSKTEEASMIFEPGAAADMVSMTDHSLLDDENNNSLEDLREEDHNSNLFQVSYQGFI
jgi:hypothetical protein